MRGFSKLCAIAGWTIVCLTAFVTVAYWRGEVTYLNEVEGNELGIKASLKHLAKASMIFSPGAILGFVCVAVGVRLQKRVSV